MAGPRRGKRGTGGAKGARILVVEARYYDDIADFLLAGAMRWFRHLHYGLAAAVGLVGLKMIGEWLLPHEEGRGLVPAWLLLAMIAALLAAAMLASLVGRRGTQIDRMNRG